MMRPSRFFINSMLFVGVAWVLGGIIMALAAGSRVLAGWGSQRWPHVNGQIVRSSVLPIKNSSGKAAFYKVAVVYAYSPPSPDKYQYAFHGDRISFRGFIDPADDSYTLSQGQQFVNQYPVCKSVVVYYSPHDLRRSALQPGTDVGTFAGSLIGVALVLLGALIIKTFRVMPAG